jgi:hypothetical protein
LVRYIPNKIHIDNDSQTRFKQPLEKYLCRI